MHTRLNTQTPKTLVCIELPRQIGSAFKALKKKGISNYRILALTPHAEYALEKLGHESLRPENYHSEEDINDVGLKDVSVLNEFCDFVDESLEKRWEILSENEIFPAHLSWYNLKIMFNSVSIPTFIFKRVLEHEQPQQVLFFGTRPRPVGRDLTFTRESVWSAVIPEACKEAGITAEPLGHDTDPIVLTRCPGAQFSGTRQKLKNLAKFTLGPTGTAVWRASKLKATTILSKQRYSSAGQTISSRPTLLTLERSYSLRHVLNHIDVEGSFNVLHWNIGQAQLHHFANGKDQQPVDMESPDLPSREFLESHGRRLWSEIMDSTQLRGFLRFWGVDVYSVLERRLQRFFEINVPEIVSYYLRARSLLKKVRPTAVLAAPMGDHRRHAVALASKIEKIPFIVYQHGSSRGYVQMESADSEVTEQNDLRSADYVFCFGEGDVQYHQNHANATAEIFAIGSAALDQLRGPVSPGKRAELLSRFGLSADKRTVMYVPNSMDGSVRVAPYRLPSPSSNFQVQQRFLDAFAEFPNVQFILKLHETETNPCSPIAQVVLDRRLDNCRVITEPFTSVMSMADMFITDSPPSTAFLEMLTTDRPVLVCGSLLTQRWVPGKWHPSVLDMWKERVVYSEDLDEFLDLLRRYLREDKFQAVETYDTLLRLFGTHLDDGNSALRAHDFIASLVDQPVALGST